jgi:hypothetical protein
VVPGFEPEMASPRRHQGAEGVIVHAQNSWAHRTSTTPTIRMITNRRRR